MYTYKKKCLSSKMSLFFNNLISKRIPPGQTGAHQKFDHAFQEFLKDHGYRGGAVAAMRAGRLLHARGYGRDRESREVTAHSHFPLSSLAKSLTSVAVLLLVQEGKLKLNAKVGHNL